MRSTPLAVALVMLITGAATFAQSPGAQRVERDSLSAFGATPLVNVFVFAERFQNPVGTTSFANVTVIDLTTFDVHQCAGATFDISILHSRSTLSFVSEDGGFNCPPGEEITVDCQVTESSGVSHAVSNGTFKIGAFDQQYHSHGTIDGYQGLACRVSALGADVDGNGSATQERGQVSQ